MSTALFIAGGALMITAMLAAAFVGYFLSQESIAWLARGVSVALFLAGASLVAFGCAIYVFAGG